MPNDKQQISVMLFSIGIASMVGSKAGEFLADRISAARTLLTGMVIHAAALAVLSIFYDSMVVMLPVIIIWAIAAWTFVPAQNYRLITLAPQASGIVLGLSNSFVQLGFALGAAVGGAVIKSFSVAAITWVGAVLVALTAAAFAVIKQFEQRAERKNHH